MIEWQELKTKDGAYNAHTYYAAMPGGWLIHIVQASGSVALTFYPDPEHKWNGSSLQIKIK